MPKINIVINIKKDVWNWWDACNKVSYGVDWKERIHKSLRDKIVGKSQKEAFNFLVPHLKDLYKKIKINKKLVEAKNIFQKKERTIFSRMEKVTDRKIYRTDFNIYLTTFPRAPYDFKKGYIWLPIIWSKETYIRTFVHELLHFQTYAYWQRMGLRKLKKEEFEDVKEALTVILNEEFIDIMEWKDGGYEKHKSLRREILKQWRRDKNFDRLVKFGVTYLKDHK